MLLCCAPREREREREKMNSNTETCHRYGCNDPNCNGKTPTCDCNQPIENCGLCARWVTIHHSRDVDSCYLCRRWTMEAHKGHHEEALSDDIDQFCAACHRELKKWHAIDHFGIEPADCRLCTYWTKSHHGIFAPHFGHDSFSRATCTTCCQFVEIYHTK